MVFYVLIGLSALMTFLRVGKIGYILIDIYKRDDVF